MRIKPSSGRANQPSDQNPGNEESAIQVVNLANLNATVATQEQLELARLLGKALYWDQQVGSGNGGLYACASCHYSAGADSQADRVLAGTLPRGYNGSPNTIRGSLGVRYAEFLGLKLENLDGEEVSRGIEVFTPPGEYAVTDRNAPPAVDSDSTHNFWDGRANYVFNGVNITGAPIVIPTRGGGSAFLQIAESSQASQAVGPCLSPAEMSADGRQFSDIGYKLRHAIPLRYQTGDVVEELGALGLLHGRGYAELIDAAFADGPLEIFLSDEPSGVKTIVETPSGDVEEREVSLSELNFAIFFGTAVALYEQTLVTIPARPPTRAQIEAFKEMRCDKCHYVDGRSHAVIGDVGNRPFSATGVAPLRVDAGVQEDDQNLDSIVPNFDADAGEGQFKSTHLFNLPLTAPYFHDGSATTLEEMMDFYVRGGDFNQRNVDSHVRELDVSKREYKLVLRLMKQLTDPRIERGEPPFSHPSLVLPLPDQREVYLAPSGIGLGGLHYTVRNTDSSTPDR
ncbi:MAG: cytochrome c peroxidase [Planctomycetota bacterium]|nr:cytochrome c peroxidase [Planctomycetota bacterium]